MALRLFNTLGQQVEEVVPLQENHLRMYTCGPTVYHFVHIGNLRTFVFQDLLRRVILYRGWRLTHVMNITDVDDKIIAAAQQQGLSIGEYTKRFTEAFLQDLKTLRIARPEQMPKATDHIQEMIDLILRLRENGLTYDSEGSVYYRIHSFRDYGKLSGVQLEQIQDDQRVEGDEYDKENARDFALWKARKEDEAWWEGPLGPGRPGWHIECSAMSMKYLGPTFDIHCGGVDLIFPHHENEIAQSEGATGKPFVRHWVHGAHLIVEGEKMSKSRGNFFTLRDLLEKGHDPVAIRYLLSSVHYRRQLNFTFEGLDQSRAALQRVNDFLQRVREIPSSSGGDPGLVERVAAARKSFEEALESDLNSSEALGTLFRLIRDTNIVLARGEVGGAARDQILHLFRDANRIFDTFDVEEPPLPDQEVARLIQLRLEARRQRDYAQADAIRDRLQSIGIILEDTREGTRWKRAR